MKMKFDAQSLPRNKKRLTLSIHSIKDIRGFDNMGNTEIQARIVSEISNRQDAKHKTNISRY